MAILVNGRELEEHGLHGMSEARRRAGLYPEGLLRVLRRNAEDELTDGGCAMVEEVQELNRALYESGANLEPPPDLSREGERKGRLKSFLRRLQTRFIRAVCEGYVQQQQFFNSYLSKGLTLCLLQIYGREEEVPLGGNLADHRAHYRAGWDRVTLEKLAEACSGSSCLVLGIPDLDFLEMLSERAHLVLALDSCEYTVARAQGRMLPAWHGTRFSDLLELAGRRADVLILSLPEIIPGLELKDVIGWAADNLTSGGRVLAARDTRFRGGVVGREGMIRPHSPAFLSSIMERRGFRVRTLRLGERTFLEGKKLGEGREAGTGGPAPDAGGG